MTMTQQTPIWQEPVTPPQADMSFLAMPGQERLEHWVQLAEAKPPFARLVGMDFMAVTKGGVVFELHPSAWLAGPKGSIHPGFLAWLADTPLAMAVETAMPAGAIVTTAELSLTFLGRVQADGGTLSATSRFLGVGGRDGLSDVALSDASGRLVAHGTSRCARLDVGVPAPLPPPVEFAPYDGTEPWQRPVVGEPLDADVLETRSGLEILRAQAAGELALPPAHHLTGIRPQSAEDGVAVFALPTGPWVQIFAGPVYGGAITFLASSAVSGSAQTLAAPGQRCDSLDIKVNFLRPAACDGRDLVAHGAVLHAGRGLVVSRAEILDADGRLVALATGSTRLG